MNYESIILEMLARIQTLESEYATIKTRLDEICAGKAPPCEVTEKENAVASARNETEDKGKISTNDIVAYIRQVIFNAKIDGRKSVVILAKDVHNALGLVSRYPMVCYAMRKCMNDGDKVLFSPTSGYSSTLKIEYFTACVKTNEQTEDIV